MKDNMSYVYLELFHGRHDPKEDMEDWGFDGPVLGPFNFIHIIYGCIIKLSTDAVDTPLIDLVDGMFYYDGAYYGDWAVFSGTPPAERLQQFDPKLARLPEKEKA